MDINYLEVFSWIFDFMILAHPAYKPIEKIYLYAGLEKIKKSNIHENTFKFMVLTPLTI